MLRCALASLLLLLIVAPTAYARTTPAACSVTASGAPYGPPVVDRRTTGGRLHTTLRVCDRRRGIVRRRTVAPGARDVAVTATGEVAWIEPKGQEDALVVWPRFADAGTRWRAEELGELRVVGRRALEVRAREDTGERHRWFELGPRARTGACPRREPYRTVLETPTMRVTRATARSESDPALTTDAWRVCDRRRGTDRVAYFAVSSGRDFRAAEVTAQTGDWLLIRASRLAGVLVADSLVLVGIDGRVAREVKAGLAPETDAQGVAPLFADGSFAFVERLPGTDDAGARTYVERLRLVRPGGERELDRAEQPIRPGLVDRLTDLRAAGDVLHWRHAGEPREVSVSRSSG